MKQRTADHPAKDRLQCQIFTNEQYRMRHGCLITLCSSDLEMDVSQMSFDSDSFDAVFDKGTLDAILYDSRALLHCISNR